MKIFVAAGLIIAAALAIIGCAVSGVTDITERCQGPISDAELCANVRLQLTIFGSIVVGSAIVGAAIVASAAVLAPRARIEAVEPETQAVED